MVYGSNFSSPLSQTPYEGMFASIASFDDTASSSVSSYSCQTDRHAGKEGKRERERVCVCVCVKGIESKIKEHKKSQNERARESERARASSRDYKKAVQHQVQVLSCEIRALSASDWITKGSPAISIPLAATSVQIRKRTCCQAWEHFCVL